MSLQVPRDIGTVAGAVAKIVETLGGGDTKAGVAAAAQLIGKTEWTIRGWLDPHKEAEPGLTAARKLDEAYYRATGLEPPLLKLYEDMISEATAGAHGSAKLNLWREMASLHIASAGVPQAVQDATHPDGPGGAEILPHEMAGIAHAADRTKDAAERVVLAARQVSKGGFKP